MKKLNYLLFLFILCLFFVPKETFAVTFTNGTSYYDYKYPNSNSYSRGSYAAPACTSSYCQFVANFSGFDYTIDYYMLETAFVNDFVKQSTTSYSFDYNFSVSYTSPSTQPLFFTDPSKLGISIYPVGISQYTSCTSTYSDSSFEGTNIKGHCVVKLNEPYHDFNRMLLSWFSTDRANVPSTAPILVYNPSKPVSITFSSTLNLSNFVFGSDSSVDMSETNKKLDEVNDNLKDMKKEQEETNKKLDETNKNLENLDKTLNDSSTDEAENKANDFFKDFNTDTYGLSDIITAPLDTIKSITSSKCNSLKLPLPYVNKDLTLPCIRSIFEEHFNPLLLLYQTATSGFIAYYVIVRLFNLIKDFKNPDHDEIEVMDL